MYGARVFLDYTFPKFNLGISVHTNSKIEKKITRNTVKTYAAKTPTTVAVFCDIGADL
jgi:hypothetical protein